MKKLIWFILIAIIITGIVYFFSRFLLHDNPLKESQKRSALQNLLGYQPVLTAQPQSGKWINYDGMYFSLRYPGDSKIYKDIKTTISPQTPEIFQFESQANPRYFFTIQISDEPNVSSYDDLSAVKLRKLSSGGYSESQIMIDNQPAILFIKNENNSLERSAFLIYQGKVYSFSITGQNPQIGEIFNKVIESIKLY